MARLVAAFLVGFVLWQVGGRIWLGHMYSIVTDRAQRNNDIHFEQPEWKPAFIGVDNNGSPIWDKSATFPSQNRTSPPYVGSHR